MPSAQAAQAVPAAFGAEPAAHDTQVICIMSGTRPLGQPAQMPCPAFGAETSPGAHAAQAAASAHEAGAPGV